MGLLNDLYSTELGAIRAVPGTTRANYDKLKGLLGVDSTGNGLLSDLNYGARNALSQAKWNAGNRLDKIQQYLTDPSARFQPSTPESRASIDEALMNLGSSVMPGGMAGMIKASHGSPHAFTKFDFSKIGTGEGAQAYGHGGYFAQGFDSPVAQEYRDKLSTKVYMGGKRLDSIPSDSPQAQAHHSVVTAMSGQKIEPQEAINNAIKYWNDAADEMLAFEKTNPELRDRIIQEANSRRAIAKEAELLKAEDFYRDPGHLYNVELRWPDAAREAADPLGEQHLLDWDAPIGGQHNSVLDALSKIDEINVPGSDWSIGRTIQNARDIQGLLETDPNKAHIYRELLDDRRINPRGIDVLGWLGGAPGKPSIEASERLRKAGIPGIRYLDQASRGAGEGTRNYVIFDDAIPRIVTRNGRSLLED